MSKNIAVFASGNGTNAERLFDYFEAHPTIKIAALFCNKQNAPVIERAAKRAIPVVVFSREDFVSGGVSNELARMEIDWLVLAGFLWLLPPALISQFPESIVNLHPSLLPKYGGKGMYGHHVHQAVLDAGDKESGITIHLVNEEYDSGGIVFQTKCKVENGDTADSLATKIHELEYMHLPGVVENLILSK